LVRYRREVRGARTLFPVLVLLDLEARNLEGAVLFHGQADRFLESETPDFSSQS